MNERLVPLRATYDADADAAYLYFAEDIGVGGVAETVPVDPSAIGGMANIDLDSEGRLLGIEVLAARSKLPATFLQSLAGPEGG